MFLFGFLKERRARSVVEGVLPALPEGVQLLGRADRAATLAIANAMLEVAAASWGPDALRDPAALPKRTAAEAVLVLAGHHVRLRTEQLEPMQRRNMDDIAYSQAMRQLRATELLIGTLGGCLLDSKPAGVRASWKMLWEAREHAVEGGRTLAAFMRHARARPVPACKSAPGKLTAADLVRLCSTLPPFLRPRKAAEPGKPAAKPGAKQAPQRAAARPAAPPARRPATAKASGR